MSDLHKIAEELGRDLVLEERLVCREATLYDEEADSLELSDAEVVWRLQRRVGASSQELARLVPSVRLAYSIAWRLAVEGAYMEALDEIDEEPEGEPSCPVCGGSGGGPEEHLRCSACGGSGL